LKKVLILTSSGGGGLLQTAHAKEQEVKEADPSAQVVQRDILTCWFGKYIGTFFAELWNRAQRTGDVVSLKLILHVAHPLFDIIFWPFLFLGALRTFFKDDPDRIIDTQPLATSAILYALRVYNKNKQKKIRLEKVLVDLPTTKATHFFRSIKQLSEGCRPWILVVTIPPLLEEGETTQEFWLKNCRLTEESIVYEEPYVRTAFRKVRGKCKPQHPISLMVRYKNPEELSLMQAIYQKSFVQTEVREGEIYFKAEPDARVITLLLGSQPASKATFNYIKRFLEIARTDTRPTLFFAFRADHRPGHVSLLNQIADWVQSQKDYPTHFAIIPFCFQKDDVIAPLFHRSDLTCTRSGGQTAMELLSVSTGEMWIHSEAKGRDLSTDKKLLKGIPGWEAASAVYLQKVKGAKLVTPETFIPLGQRFFGQVSPNPAAG
jgi:hypothetical protein